MTISPQYGKNKNMRTEILAVIIQAGTQLCSEILRLRSHRPKQMSIDQSPLAPPAEPQETTEETSENKVEKGTACLPCVNGHSYACIGFLSEANRMSPDGLNSDSLFRVDKCLGEIAAAERIDLAEEKIAKLPPEEQVIARNALKEFREIRHDLEGITSKEVLQKANVKMIELQKYVGGEWLKIRLAKMPKQEKAKLLEKVMNKLEGE